MALFDDTIHDISPDGFWRASRHEDCPICGRDHGCSETADGLHFCLGEGEREGWRYFGRCSRDETFGLYRQVGDVRGSERVRPGPEERQRERDENYQKFIEGEGKTLEPIKSGTPEMATLRKMLPHFTQKTLAELDWVSSPDCYSGSPGVIERNGKGEPTGVAFRLSNGRRGKLSHGGRGLTIPRSLLPEIRDFKISVIPGPIFIVEGASDVLACTEMGLVAIGRPSNKGGAADLVEFIRTHIPRERWDIIVLGENDQHDDGKWPGRDGAVRVAQQLADGLGIVVRRAMPPVGKKDVREFFERESRRKGHPSPGRLGRELLSFALITAKTVTPRVAYVPLPKEAPPITSGPAAVRAFDAGIRRDPGKLDCPNSTTISILKDGLPCTISTRCKCNTCRTCRTANVVGFLLRAEDGINRDLQDGCRLATFDGEGVSADAMGKRLRQAAGYVRLSLPLLLRFVVVATFPSTATLPKGFKDASSDEAATMLRHIEQLAEEDATFGIEDGKKNARPLSLSRSWSRSPEEKAKEKVGDSLLGNDHEEGKSPPPAEVLRSHAVRDFRVIAEALRGIDLDAGSLEPDLSHTFFEPELSRNPRTGGRVQWSLSWNPIRPLTAGEILTVLHVLDALPREGGRTHPPEWDEPAKPPRQEQFA